MKTGVLVHGCNLHIENWRYVAWGDPPHDLGRIPQGILTAIENQTELIVFGTGASKKIFTLGVKLKKPDRFLPKLSIRWNTSNLISPSWQSLSR